jgi:hypothetical protein
VLAVETPSLKRPQDYDEPTVVDTNAALENSGNFFPQ